jgi:hypothetical protein
MERAAVRVVAAVVALTEIMGAVAMASAPSIVIQVTTTREVSTARNAKMIVAMDAQAMRMRGITVEAGLRSVGAVQRARTCAAATS